MMQRYNVAIGKENENNGKKDYKELNEQVRINSLKVNNINIIKMHRNDALNFKKIIEKQLRSLQKAFGDTKERAFCYKLLEFMIGGKYYYQEDQPYNENDENYGLPAEAILEEYQVHALLSLVSNNSYAQLVSDNSIRLYLYIFIFFIFQL